MSSDLSDRLVGGNVSVVELAKECITSLPYGHGKTDNVGIMASHLLRAAHGAGLDLSTLPGSLVELQRVADLSWIGADSHRLTELQQQMATIRDWSTQEAHTHALDSYGQLRGFRAEDEERYSGGLERARQLRTAVLVMNMSPTEQADESVDTIARFFRLKQRMLDEVELAIYQLEHWLGDAPVPMSGEEYRAKELVRLQKEIDDIMVRATQNQHESGWAYDLLMRLQSALYFTPTG